MACNLWKSNDFVYEVKLTGEDRASHQFICLPYQKHAGQHLRAHVYVHESSQVSQLLWVLYASDPPLKNWTTDIAISIKPAYVWEPQ